MLVAEMVPLVEKGEEVSLFSCIIHEDLGGTQKGQDNILRNLEDWFSVTVCPTRQLLDLFTAKTL